VDAGCCWYRWQPISALDLFAVLGKMAIL